MSNKTFIAILIGLVIVLCCVCLAGAALVGGAFFLFNETPTVTSDSEWYSPTQSSGQSSTHPDDNSTLTPIIPVVPTFSTQELDPSAKETLNMLQAAEVPNNNLLDLAENLEGKQNIPETLPAPSTPLTVGSRQTFFATNTDTNENFKVNATLRYITDHTYFWIEDGVDYDEGDLRSLMNTFEDQIYPTDREFFGSEWTPGVDNDPHLYILYASNLGSNLAGYYSSADEYSPQAHEYSNGHEMFMLNVDNLYLGEEYTYGVLAHEFQHMIHWYTDRNEESWLNEGFSVLAEMLNNYDLGGFDQLYLMDPDLQLNDWPNDPNATSPHYGEGFLYLAYFLDRFGEEMTQSLVSSQENGLVSIDDVLAQSDQVDSQTGEPITADDIFQDWTITNYLNDPSVGDGRYAYQRYNLVSTVDDTDTVYDCPASSQTYTVNQYGADYIKIACSGNYTLTFQGNTEIGVIPENAHSGEFSFWSNKGDESDMTLTQSFDFSTVSGPLTLNYYTWYDLETDYDYLYLEAREEGGNWQILTTPSGTADDPSGNSYGWGYNGVSDGWIEESVDLSQFSGKKIELRFEYVTDAAVNGEGLLLDDVSIPEIGYQTDFETDDGGWTAAGFVRMVNILPQTFRVSLIYRGGETVVDRYTVEAGQTLEVPLNISGNVEDVVVVVSGTTRFTRQAAEYQINIK